jgi:EmrB/QacA subfamily drug resistance transporter
MARKWWTLILVCASMFMLLLDLSVVFVALPSIQRDLDASFVELNWVIDVYALALATVVLNAGSLADLYGRKRLFLIGLGAFVAGSALCGAATTPLFLILARAAQGIGGATLFATTLALLSQEFHGRERGVAFGFWGATNGAALAAGPLVGGALTTWLGWRWVFLVNIPIGVAVFALALFKLRETRDEEHGGIDLLGMATLSGGMFGLVLALLRGNEWGWTSGREILLYVLVVLLLAAFVAAEVLQSRPMFELSLLRRPAFAGAQIAVFGFQAGSFALIFYLTIYLQNVLGYSAIGAGVRLLPQTFLSFVAAPLAGRLTAYVPPRILIATGLGLIGGGFLLMHGLTVENAWTALLPGMILVGFGTGTANPPMASTAIAVVEPRRAGMASGVNNTARQLGTATGIAAFGALFEHRVAARLHGAIPGGHDAVQAVASGNFAAAIAHVPSRAHDAAELAARQAFISALNEVLLVGVGVLFVAAVLCLALIRGRDFARAPQPAAEPA